jgi:hypothetical protein
MANRTPETMTNWWEALVQKDRSQALACYDAINSLRLSLETVDPDLENLRLSKYASSGTLAWTTARRSLDNLRNRSDYFTRRRFLRQVEELVELTRRTPAEKLSRQLQHPTGRAS